MARTTIGTREVRDQSVARSDLDTQTPGEAVISKIIAGAGISLSWTGVDSGTGDVTISNSSGVSGPVPLEAYEVADWYGGQQLINTPITVNLDGPRYTNSNYTNAAGEIEFLISGLHLVVARVTAKTISSSDRTESSFNLEQDIGAGWETIWGTKAILYHRNSSEGGNSAAVSCLFNASIGDKIRIRAFRTSGSATVETIDDGSGVTIVSLTGTQGEKGDKGDKGDPGLDGTNGTDGLDGDDGSMIYTGSGAPSDTLGKDGDIYINTATNEYYQKGSSVSGEWGTPIGVLGSGGGTGVTDHGGLTGLFDDDHPQYFNQTRGDIRYAAIDHTHSISSLGSEFALSLQKLEVLHWMGVN